jgi:NitT/TauT family transport system substrate-binding protein
MRRIFATLVQFVVAVGLLYTWSASAQEPLILRVGHFPNITHVQALVAHGLSRQGKGWFESRLGPNAQIQWFVYNAGPSAMEAIFARSIDLTYVGPNPAINAYVKSRGAEVRIVAGAVNGGSALVIQGNSTLAKAADFRGKRIATPQFGNTQDVSARAWLIAGGFNITQTGGDAQVIPTANPDQLTLFKQGTLDAVWTVEPWVSRLELEAGGRVLLEDRDAITTILVARADFLSLRRDVARKFVAAHAELNDWIRNNPDEAKRLAREELNAEMHGSLSAELVEKSWPRIQLTDTISREALDSFLHSAQSVGFLRNVPDMSKLRDLP